MPDIIKCETPIGEISAETGYDLVEFPEIFLYGNGAQMLRIGVDDGKLKAISWIDGYGDREDAIYTFTPEQLVEMGIDAPGDSPARGPRIEVPTELGVLWAEVGGEAKEFPEIYAGIGSCQVERLGYRQGEMAVKGYDCFALDIWTDGGWDDPEYQVEVYDV